MRLQLDEVARAGLPGVDVHSRLFQWDGRLFRAFKGADADLIASLVDDAELFDAGLVSFEPADLEVEGHDLVVEVQRVPQVSYANEWPTRMVKEAALCILRVARALAQRGLRMKDAHPWNVLFEYTRPVFVDLGSITTGAQVSWGWVAELRRHLLVPLWLHARGQHKLAQEVLREHHPAGFKQIMDHKLLQLTAPAGLPLRYMRHRRDPVALYDGLTRWLERQNVRGRTTGWSGYDAKDVPVTATDRFDAKKGAVDAFLRELAPGHVLDMAANIGWFSRLAVHHGHTVTAFDIDDPSLCVLFDRAAADGHPINVMKMDVLYPRGSYGMALSIADAYSRTESDVVLAIAVLHHLCRNYGIRFEVFAKILDRLARRAAIVEFIPSEDEHVGRWPLANEPWYTLDGLVEAMRPYFPYHEVAESSPSPRKMVLFRRG